MENEPNHNHEHDHQQHALHLTERQTKALEALAKRYAPKHMEIEEKRWKAFIGKMVALFSIIMSVILGGKEGFQYLKQQYEMRTMAQRYAEVAQEIYNNENNAEVALPFITKAIELQDSNVDYRYLQAYIDGLAVVRRLENLDRPLTKDEVDQAHKAIANALLLKRLAANRPEPYILQGQIYAALKENDRASVELKRAIELDPKNDFAHVRMALVLNHQSKNDEALAEIEQAITLNPKSKWAWLWKGFILADARKDWDGARAAYAKALEIDPRFDLALYNQGQTYLRQEPQDYKQARALFERALAVNPNFKEAYYAMGMLYGYQDLYEIATVYLDKAIALDKLFLTAWKYHGIVQTEQGLYEPALTDFSKAIELAPSEPELYVRRARVFEKTDKIDKAVADLRFAAELAPEDKRTWLYLGDVFLKINELDKAMGYYEQAVRLDAKYAEAYSQQAKVWAKRGNADEAQKALDKAVEVATYKPERFLLERGKLLEGKGANDAALADYRAAHASDAAFADAWLAEAKLLQQTAKKDDALTAIGKYIDLRPTDKAAQELRKQIHGQ